MPQNATKLNPYPSEAAAEHTLAEALKYAAAGIKVFPLSILKIPCITGWKEIGTTDEATLRKWFLNSPFSARATMIGMHAGANGLVVLDADKKPGRANGVSNLRRFYTKIGIDRAKDLRGMPVTITPSGSEHHFFRQPAGGRIGNSSRGLPAEIDVRGDGGLVALPGSTNGKGVYVTAPGAPTLIEAFTSGTIPVLPDPLVKILGQKKERPKGAAAVDPLLPHDLVVRILRAVPNDKGYFDARDTWTKFGFAVFAASGGDAYSEWLDWCGRWDGGGDPEKDGAFWDSIESAACDLSHIKAALEHFGLDELRHEVSQAEAAKAFAASPVNENDPVLLAETHRALLRDPSFRAIFGDDDDDPAPPGVGARKETDDAFVWLGGSHKRLVTVDDVDARFGQLEAPGLPAAYVYRPDLLPITTDDLLKRLGGEVVFAGRDKHGDPIYAPAARAWKDYAKRHRYRKIVFTNKPNLSADTLNLFRGLGAVPKEGDCSKIINHVFEVLASGDMGAGGFLIKLCAWQLQNIGKPSRVIVIMKSEQQQVGKGLFLNEVLCPIFGPSAFVTANMEQVTGRFNYHLSGVSLVFLDEVLFGGDKKAGDAIKMLSTATTLGLEPKGLPIIHTPVAFNFWLCSNHASAAHIEKTDARYVVLDVSPHRFGDRAYFGALLHEINNGGREAFAHYLLNLDLDGFVPWNDMPRTEAKRAMQWESVNPYDARKWLEACCHAGAILGSEQRRHGPDAWVAGDKISFANLLRAYTEWQKSVRSPVSAQPTKPGALGALLSRVGFASHSTGAERIRILPPTDECLEKLREN